MNLQSLPTEIVQLVAKQGRQEIENLKYSNKYFYGLFSDSHMKKEITPASQIPKFPFGEWGTRMFFIECFRNRKFGRLVSFFNEEDLNLCKDDMLYLCIRFMDRMDLDNLLSKIKLSFIKTMRLRNVIQNKTYKQTIKYLQEKYLHLFCGMDDPFHIVQVIDENYTIDQLYSSLINELNRKTIELQNSNFDIITENYQDLDDSEHLLLTSCGLKFLNFLTEEQKNFFIMSENTSITLLATFFLINGNSLKQNFNTEEIKTINHVIGDLLSSEISLIMKYCSIEAIKELLDAGVVLNEENVKECAEFFITFDSEKMNLVVEKIATFSNENFRNVLTLISDSIGVLYVTYRYHDEFLVRTEELISCIPFEMIRKILSLDFGDFNYYYGDIVNSFYLLIRYVKENPNIIQESQDISSLLNIRIKQALDCKVDISVKHIYTIKELNFTVLYLYCFDEHSRIDQEKANKILSILKYIYKTTENINIFNRSIKTFQVIQYKLFEDRTKNV